MAHLTFTQLCRTIAFPVDYRESILACAEWERRFPDQMLTVGMVDYFKTMPDSDYVD